MKGLETGKDKVKKICEALRKETLEPAKQEAEEILAHAHAEAARIIEGARKAAEDLHAEVRAALERQKNVFNASLAHACKQALESLKQQIEERFFNRELKNLIARKTQDPQLIAELVRAVVRAIDKEGIDADLSAYVPAAVPADAINALLGKEVLDRLREKSVLIGSMDGGASVKLHNENITIDITDEALRELVASYARKDFREMFFGNS